MRGPASGGGAKVLILSDPDGNHVVFSGEGTEREGGSSSC